MRILYYRIIILYSHNLTFIDTFSIRVFAPEWLHINDFELLRTVLGTEFRRTSFRCWKNTICSECLCFILGSGPWGPDPWSKAPGAHGAPHFSDCLSICKMVRDLSRSVPRVFRSLGKPLIKLFHFIFNSKCHFWKDSFLYNCLLYCLLNSRSTA